MREMIYRKFDWSSLLQYNLLDAERVRIGKVVDVVDSADASSVFVKVVEQANRKRSMLIDTASIGVIGNGWAMLDQPLRSAGAFFHEMSEEPDEQPDTEDLDGADAYPELDETLDIVHASCPFCGSSSHIS